MTSEERVLLKQLVDHAKRARLERSTRGSASCHSCRQPFPDVNYGCPTCVERFRGMWRRKVESVARKSAEKIALLQGRCAELESRVEEATAEAERWRRLYDRIQLDARATLPRYATEEARLEARRRSWREYRRRVRTAGEEAAA